MQALGELTTIADTASDANRPGDLDATIEQVKQELERLDLEGFFGEDGGAASAAQSSRAGEQ